MLTYGSTIIEKTKTNVSTESANVIFGLTQFGATILAGELIDRKGRKFLLIGRYANPFDYGIPCKIEPIFQLRWLVVLWGTVFYQPISNCMTMGLMLKCLIGCPSFVCHASYSARRLVSAH